MRNISPFIISLVCCVVVCGCRPRGAAVTSEFGDILYSRSTLDDAITFTGAPAERREKFNKVVRGTLADADHLAFARSLLQARDQQDVDAFRRLLHQESLALLDKPGEKQMVHAMVQQVKSGEFLYAKENPKFFITQGIPQERDFLSLFAESAAKPSTTITFYQYYQPKNMLVGTKFFLVEEGGALKVIFPVRRQTAQQPPERDK